VVQGLLASTLGPQGLCLRIFQQFLPVLSEELLGHVVAERLNVWLNVLQMTLDPCCYTAAAAAVPCWLLSGRGKGKGFADQWDSLGAPGSTHPQRAYHTQVLRLQTYWYSQVASAGNSWLKLCTGSVAVRQGAVHCVLVVVWGV